MQNDSGLLLFENLRPGAPRVDLREMSPLALAFVGDGVYEVLVRRMLVEAHAPWPQPFAPAHGALCLGKGACAALEAIRPMLTEAEQNVDAPRAKRRKATVAKHATAQEYRASTAFEALLGWLYLKGEVRRIEELFAAVCRAAESGAGQARP